MEFIALGNQVGSPFNPEVKTKNSLPAKYSHLMASQGCGVQMAIELPDDTFHLDNRPFDINAVQQSTSLVTVFISA